jgi:hypothetical protein
MAGFVAVEALPRETTALTPAIEPFEQQLSCRFFEATLLLDSRVVECEDAVY